MASKKNARGNTYHTGGVIKAINPPVEGGAKVKGGGDSYAYNLSSPLGPGRVFDSNSRSVKARRK